MNKKYFLLLLFFTPGFFQPVLRGQNISINTTGAANSSLSMLEILQISATANSRGLYISHSGNVSGSGYGIYSEITGVSTTNYGGYFTAANATTNIGGYFSASQYAIIVPSGGGTVGIGTSAPNSGFGYLMEVYDGNLFVKHASNNFYTGIVGKGTNSTGLVFRRDGTRHAAFKWDGTKLYLGDGSADCCVADNWNSPQTTWDISTGRVGFGTTSPTAGYLATFLTNATNGRAIDVTLTAGSGNGVNVTSASSGYNNIVSTNSGSASATYYAVGGHLTSAVAPVSGYLGYHTGTGNTAANYFAGYFNGKVAVTSNSSPDGIADLEVQNTTSGAGNPATLFLRQTTSNTTSGTVLANINFGDNYSTSPQAQISVTRGAASGSSSDLPTDIVFSTTPDGSTTLTNRMRITRDGYVGIGTNFPTSLPAGAGNTPTLLHLFDAGTAATDFPQLILSTGHTTATNKAGELSFASSVAATDRRTASIESYITAVSGAPNVSGDLRFFTNNSSTGVLAERMRIQAAGNVGIGGAPFSTTFLDLYPTTGMTEGVWINMPSNTASNTALGITNTTNGSTATKYGINSTVSDNNAITKYGVYSQATGTAGTKYGGLFSASGAGTNYGIHATANTNTGDFAAYFNGILGIAEQTIAPSTPTANTEVKMYVKADKLVIQFYNGTTTKYWYLDLTSTTNQSWIYTTTAP